MSVSMRTVLTLAAVLGLAACLPVPDQARGPATCESVAAAGGWKTERSLAQGVVPRGGTIELGVEGARDASVKAIVRTPKGEEVSTDKTQVQHRGGPAANYVVRYPADFAAGGAIGGLGAGTPGTYAVRWEADGRLAACDSFEVAAIGVGDARACAPAGWSASAPFGSGVLSISSGTARMSIRVEGGSLGLVADPWYAFQPHERQAVVLPDGSRTTLRVSRSARPRQVAATFVAGAVPYRFDASAEAVPDLVEISHAVIACAQQRLAGSAAAATPRACPRTGGPAPTIDPRPQVFPSAAVLRVGESHQFVAAHQEAGCFGPPATVRWTVSPPGAGAITADGVFTAREAGTATITATTSGSFTGTATVKVERQ